MVHCRMPCDKHSLTLTTSRASELQAQSDTKTEDSQLEEVDVTQDEETQKRHRNQHLSLAGQ